MQIRIVCTIWNKIRGEWNERRKKGEREREQNLHTYIEELPTFSSKFMFLMEMRKNRMAQITSEWFLPSFRFGWN